ncbi:SusD/RagB family nutrient-binding outer membrane lipoprotein [Belliella marina]|uniref:SusD/RagB family nutrient-binding outer membrane lipoprotein n=1 Tax=Belliella marina TaxID=1644146 RepID=A0ABW4VPT2_9BACT
MKTYKHYKKHLAIIFAGLFLVSCGNFDEINTNPNTPNQVTSQMLATSLILDIARVPNTKGFLMDDLLSKYMAWSEFVQGEQYNRIERVGFDGLIILNQVDKMVGFAPNEAQKNSYKALGHFIKAYKLFELTRRVGDIPASDALKGETDDIYNPKYDSQKEVFQLILNELNESDQLFSQGSNFDGDPVYNGNVAKWRKLVNSFFLKVLINLDRKADDPDLGVKSKFQQILSGKPIFEGNNDNFQLTYSDKENQRYPFYKLGNNFIIYNMVGSPIIDSLKSHGDYRLFHYAKPTSVRLNQGISPADWEAYEGIDPSVSFTALSQIASGGDYSTLNERYTEIPEGEPTFHLSYAEVNFIIAEAAARGWVGANARQYYEEGIRAAMQFVASHTPDQEMFHKGRKITNDYINTYLGSEKVLFASDVQGQIKQIVFQKYLSNFLQSPFEGYFENRRTGIPEFPIDPTTNLNEVSDQMPKRWMYSQAELNFNTEHVNQAIQRQFAGNDHVNALMWILKD